MEIDETDDAEVRISTVPLLPVASLMPATGLAQGQVPLQLSVNFHIVKEFAAFRVQS
jgi:hypothetical protein